MIQSYKKKPELQEFSGVLTATALTQKKYIKESAGFQKLVSIAIYANQSLRQTATATNYLPF